LTSAHPSLQLVRTLANLAAGRHISIWSARPTEEQLLETSEVSGSVNPGGHDIAMVSLTNLGDSLAHTLGAIGNGNKLDYYARRNLDVEVNIGARSARVVETFTLRNETPLGLHGKPLPRYVAGPEHPGRLHELIAFSLAANANITSFTRNGQIQLATFDNENGARRVSFVYDLQRGQQATWMLSYNVPLDHGTYQLDVIPQPLAQPATLRVAVTADPGRQLDWLPGEGPRPKGGVVDTGPRPWTTVTHIAVRLHHRHGWDAIRHAISDFFTKPVS
jgi:hypothetical protein